MLFLQIGKPLQGRRKESEQQIVNICIMIQGPITAASSELDYHAFAPRRGYLLKFAVQRMLMHHISCMHRT